MSVTFNPASDTAKVAERLRYCWNHTDNEDEERLVVWLAGHLAEALGHPDGSNTYNAFMRDAVGR